MTVDHRLTQERRSDRPGTAIQRGVAVREPERSKAQGAALDMNTLKALKRLAQENLAVPIRLGSSRPRVHGANDGVVQSGATALHPKNRSGGPACVAEFLHRPVQIGQVPQLAHRMQMLNYANASGIDYAGLTDGNHWELYDCRVLVASSDFALPQGLPGAVTLIKIAAAAKRRARYQLLHLAGDPLYRDRKTG